MIKEYAMKILYCRIGWMTAYKGNLNERPQRGGAYNKENIGHEVYNYLGYNKKYYGYVEPGHNKGNPNSIHIEKFGEGKKAKKADKVLVVWTSTRPEGGQYIIGWYNNATVYRNLEKVPSDAMEFRELKECNTYNIYSDDVKLLEIENRKFAIDRMGRNAFWYGEEDFNKEVIEYINNYNEDSNIRIAKIESGISDLIGDVKEVLISARVNQDKFRENLLKRNKHCCLCYVNNNKLLIASHIKPWSLSDGNEKLDENNGLLLCPNHDKLFDTGMISFDDDGKIIISNEMDNVNCINMNIREDMKIEGIENKREYMKYHRENIFKNESI